MRQKQLFNPLFLVAVVLLMLNDFYFKYQFHNYFTGKLSDVVGLFAFPYFFSTFFPKRAKLIYVFTAVYFTFWKSGLSQPLIDAAHSIGLGIGRTIDYTDCFALFILPLSYRYWQLPDKFSLHLNACFKPVVIGICCFAFVATKLKEQKINKNLKSDLAVRLTTTKESVITLLQLKVIKDSTYSCDIDIPDSRSYFKTVVKVYDVKDGKVTIQLDSIVNCNISSRPFIGYNEDELNYLNGLTLADCEGLFMSQKVSKLFPKQREE